MSKDVITCVVKWNKRRKFGVELEFNARSPVSSRNWLKSRIRESLARQNIVYHRVEIRDWERTHNNDYLWICKTDSSCGYEVCTPPLHGPNELKILGNVCKDLGDAGAVFSDNCGLHVHLSLLDFNEEQMCNMLMYWIKIEHNVMHAHPISRQENTRYCPTAISRIQDWESDRLYNGRDLFRALHQYRGAINTRYWNDRKTIEWRMGEMTLDPDSIKNRIRFLIWFVDICKNLPPPENLNLFTPKQMIHFLGLWNDETGMVRKIFSPAIKSMRSWLLDRMEKFIPIHKNQVYQRDRDQVIEIKKNLSLVENKMCYNNSIFEEEI